MTTDKLREKVKIEYLRWKTQTPNQRKEWENKVSKLEEKWKKWLFKDEGVEKNPKREKCFQIAWEEGHSYGYEEVESCFRDLVELIR
jgi:hypothetical protein